MKQGLDNTKSVDSDMLYICVECLAPNQTTYKMHPSGLSVKLTRCTECNCKYMVCNAIKISLLSF